MEYTLQEARVCEENIEASLEFDKKVDSCFEEIAAALKDMNLGALYNDCMAVKENWENGLKVSHAKTREFYEKAGESFKSTYQVLGLGEVY